MPINDWKYCSLRKCPYGKEYGDCEYCIYLIRKERTNEDIKTNKGN